MTAFMCVLLLAGMAGRWVWKRLKARRADRDEMEQLLRETFQSDTAGLGPVAERFEQARESLLALIPAAPLCPPALRRWKETEAELSADPSFTAAVADVLRHTDQT